MVNLLICQTSYWVVYGSPPNELEQLQHKLDNLEQTQKELLASLKLTTHQLQQLQQLQHLQSVQQLQPLHSVQQMGFLADPNEKTN